MGIIDKVRSDREGLAIQLEKHPGLAARFEDTYPDQAHFIFELLQNAEDAGATEVRFDLRDDLLSFEHCY